MIMQYFCSATVKSEITAPTKLRLSQSGQIGRAATHVGVHWPTHGEVVVVDFKNTGKASLSVLLLSGVSAEVLAQDGADQAADDGRLERVIVTARKVAEDLQETPIAVTAVSSERLFDAGAVDITEIARFTPGLNLDGGAAISGSSSSVTAFIRGVGQTDFNLTIDPGVGIYLDGVYISRSVGALLDTVDVEQIEVLRGPQGTLFGKNTIGGAISITSKKPGDTFSASGTATTGSDDRLDLSLNLDLPVSDALKLRVSAASFNQDGYVERLVDGEMGGDRRRVFGRVVGLLDVTDALTLEASVDATSIRENGLPFVMLETNDEAVFPTFYNVFLNGADCAPGVPGREANPNCFTPGLLLNDPYTTGANDQFDSDTDLWGAALTGTLVLDAVELKSITSFRSLDSNFGLDSEASQIGLVTTVNDYSQEQFSQEFQVTGEGFDGRMNWLAGLYYLEETGTDINTLETIATDFLSGGDVENESFAAFAQITHDLTDRLSLTIGGRYTDETKSFVPNQRILSVEPAAQAPLPPGSPFPFFLTNPQTTIITGVPQPLLAGDLIVLNEEVTTDAEEFTPSVSLSYRFNTDVSGYVSYSEGFKSGGFTQRLFPPEAPLPSDPTMAPPAPEFQPEFVETIEVGLKTDLFDNRLRWNSAVFFNDYTDLQIIVTEGFAPKVRNAGAASIWGVETEFQALLNDRISIDGSLAYLNAEYDQVDPAAAPVTVSSELVNAPEWSGSLGANVTLWETTTSTVRSRIDWSYTGEHFKDAINTATLRQDAYSLLSANVTYDSLDGNWSVTVGGRNLTDEAYFVAGSSDLNVIGSTVGAYARPREWYLRLTAAY